ncbi:MAG: methyl-accepting chemotaxis protein [Myxococcota bacterium]
MFPLWFKLSLPFLVSVALSLLVLLAAPDATALHAVALIVSMCVGVLGVQLQLQPLTALQRHMDGLATGDTTTRPLDLEREDELGQMSQAADRMMQQMNQISQRVERLSRGDIQIAQKGQRLTSAKRLSDADLPIPMGASSFERRFLELNNTLRRLTLQARVIAGDDLHSPLLDERVAGELGDAFAEMVRNLRGLAGRAKRIADGDLTGEGQAEGELGSAFDAMISSLQGIVHEIIMNTIRLSTASEEILQVLRTQELAASHQASGVEETQRTMETLLSSAKKIAESAQTVFKSAERTQLNNRIIADRANELKRHTERIGEILESIKDIADRSDLLALNASLEGLRAGEAGKGFTLVAGEMRRLAEYIKGSVSDIKDLLDDIRESALSSVMAIEEGSRLSDRTTDSALKITLITQQQQSGTEQVTQSMEDLSDLINQGLAGTQEVTLAASELASLSDTMRKLVDTFKLNIAPTGELLHADLRRRAASLRAEALDSGAHLPLRQLDADQQAEPGGERAEPPSASTGDVTRPAPRAQSREKRPLRRTIRLNPGTALTAPEDVLAVDPLTATNEASGADDASTQPARTPARAEQKTPVRLSVPLPSTSDHAPAHDVDDTDTREREEQAHVQDDSSDSLSEPPSEPEDPDESHDDDDDEAS